MKYLVLVLKMKEKEITIEAFAQFLKCHRNSVYNKLRGKGNSDFTIEEAFAIRNNFFQNENVEELFAIKRLSNECESENSL